MTTLTQNASVIESLRSGVQFFLTRAGQNAQAIQSGMSDFWTEIQPDVYQLMVDAAAGRPAASESLQLFADAAVARATNLALQFDAQEQAALGAILLTGLKTAVSLAAAAAFA